MHVPHNPSLGVRDGVCGCIVKNESAPLGCYTLPSDDASSAPALPFLALRRGDGNLCFDGGGSDLGAIGPADRVSSLPAAAAAAAAAAFFGGGELLLADGGDFRL